MTPKTSSRDIIKSLNYNVKLLFSYSALNSLGQGVWMFTALSMYIYLLAKDDGFWGLSEAVILGLTSAASGITMTLFVFPAGFLADKFRRDTILKIAGVFGFASLAFLAFGNSFIYIFISLFLFGMFNAFVNPSIQAIFADSVTSGYRSRIYSWVHLVNQGSNAIGPFLGAILFAIFGDSWDIPIIKKVMYVGFSITVLAIILLYFFKDKKSLGKESESIPEEIAQATTDEESKSRLALKVDSVKSQKLIPILLISSNLIIGIGAGMTIKYFPVFFSLEYTMDPILMQIIMGITSLVTGILTLISQKLSLKLGRVQTIFLVQYIATACLAVITIYPPLGLLIPLFIMRGSFMNAGQPLSQSILMDIIPKKRRGMWNSIQSIAWGLFWNASVIGGFIIGDGNNFNLCFIITTFVYIAGMIPLIIMIPLVGKEREAKKASLKEKEDKLSILNNELEMHDEIIDTGYDIMSEAFDSEKQIMEETK